MEEAREDKAVAECVRESVVEGGEAKAWVDKVEVEGPAGVLNVMRAVVVVLLPMRERGVLGGSELCSELPPPTPPPPDSLGALEAFLDPLGLVIDMLPKSLTNPLIFFPKLAPP